MYKLWAIIKKEYLLLWRDRASLAVLFVMPVILVLVVTLVQHNVLKSTSPPDIQILFINHDKGFMADRLVMFLDESPSIELIKEINGRLRFKQGLR